MSNVGNFVGPRTGLMGSHSQSSRVCSSLSSTDDQAFQEKIRELSKYIEPLRRVIQLSGNEGVHLRKMNKMKKLLEILSSSERYASHIKIETLLKCELVLKKMDIRCNMKEQNPLIEAITTSLRNPNVRHTFRRTFEPVMSVLNGVSPKGMVKPLKRVHVKQYAGDTLEVLQGEVARLDQRFKVLSNTEQQNNSKCINLLCWIDDSRLPCIPPVQIMIPEDYPNSSPKCDLSNYEYGATKFLHLIQEALRSRISELPPKYTMSQLLEAWESSLREMCSSRHYMTGDHLFGQENFTSSNLHYQNEH